MIDGKIDWETILNTLSLCYSYIAEEIEKHLDKKYSLFLRTFDYFLVTHMYSLVISFESIVNPRVSLFPKVDRFERTR